MNTESREQYTRYYVIMAMVFITCLIVSNLIAGKVWSVTDKITVPAAVILFPVTYILSDVFTEVYGFRKAKTIIWTGFACNLVAVLAYVITVLLPYPSFWMNQEDYAIVLGLTPRVLAASYVGYLFGEFSNSFIMSKLKVITEGKRLWVRTIGSTVVGEGFDSVIFITIAFAGTMPAAQIASMILFQYLFKVLFEVILTPVTYQVIAQLKKREGIDKYDYEKDYRIFR